MDGGHGGGGHDSGGHDVGGGYNGGDHDGGGGHGGGQGGGHGDSQCWMMLVNASQCLSMPWNKVLKINSLEYSP